MTPNTPERPATGPATLDALLAEVARQVPLPSFAADGRVVFLSPIGEPGRIAPVLFALSCPRCDRPWKLAAFRVQLLPAHPGHLTIDGLVRCPHECGWVAEVVHGVARVLGPEGLHA